MTQESNKRIIVGISGASGAVYGITALKMLIEAGYETHLVITRAAERVIEDETEYKAADLRKLAYKAWQFMDVGAAVASGSFTTCGMIVAPCSVKTLSGVANSFSDNLLLRAADVCLKEGRPLLLAVRETPLHHGHLRLCQLAAEAGAIIFPPVPAFYAKPQSVDDLVRHSVGRMLARMGIETNHYLHWGEQQTE